MKTILVLAHDDAGQSARLQAAIDITRGLSGHLKCLDVAIVPETVADYRAFGGDALMVADEQRSEAGNQATLQARLEREAISFEIVATTGDVVDCLRHALPLTDLVVLNRALDQRYPDMLELVGRLLAEERRPVVAVPEQATGFMVEGRALVAWDGSRSAEAALQAALPLLRKARSVTLFRIEDGSQRGSVEDAVWYLARHHIQAHVRHETKPVDWSSQVLLDVASDGSADYLVMGGFGHARALEAMFGGATRALLLHSPIPILLAHRP